MRRAGLSFLAAALATALLTCPQAAAISPPVVDPAVPPPDGTPGPVVPMEQHSECAVSGVIPGTDPGAGTAGQLMLNLPAAWQFSRGEGQTVAILDTGVRPGSRLPDVAPGGDYVESTDGLTDCDGHGTAIAGIVAGQPGRDGFSGVAPAARLLSIRVTSTKFSPRITGGDPALRDASVEVAALGRAIVRAADLGARVITVATPICLPADRTVEVAALGAAIRYAAVTKDAVIVAAAGDNGFTGSAAGGTGCESNPLADPGRAQDPRNWAGVTTVSIPSWWQPYVLSAAALTAGGQPSKATMSGPWVGVAAPGEDVVSVSNGGDGDLANGLPDQRQRLVPLTGTGYAAGSVAGVAALVRSRFPGLTATQVVDRLTATAHNAARDPSNLVGAGALDAVAALTWELPADTRRTPPVKQLIVPPAPAPKSRAPQVVAFAGTGALALVLAAAAIAYRRKEPTG
ncbi:MAG: type VII secretion-associated serine protease mycosin [Mycobacterium sp.]|uniref:type VII secretion-associated serine protease mycosin n=1 Tax=Mycobacterium sp. TaxID=1785 RepID=UPI00261C5BC8|nr:type VII secretion-associated serine protease mycosin [Mycobacterium sp.]MDI3313404.1 type VII secretion-associated serine protease mycosin [Mycobacterium sp.]